MSKRSGARAGLPVINEYAAAIDIRSRFHVAAVAPDLCAESVRTFQAFTGDVEHMADWFLSLGIKTVAMESTGVYWVPVYEILETRGLDVSSQTLETRAQFLDARPTLTMLNGCNGFMHGTPARKFSTWSEHHGTSGILACSRKAA